MVSKLVRSVRRSANDKGGLAGSLRTNGGAVVERCPYCVRSDC